MYDNIVHVQNSRMPSKKMTFDPPSVFAHFCAGDYSAPRGPRRIRVGLLGSLGFSLGDTIVLPYYPSCTILEYAIEKVDFRAKNHQKSTFSMTYYNIVYVR